MIVAEFRTEDLPAKERFGAFHDLTVDAFVPTIVKSAHRDDFRASLKAWDLGVAQVSAMTYPSLESTRPAKLIRRSDPELYSVMLTLHGEQRITQVSRTRSHGPYDLVFFDSSRPFHGRVVAPEGSSVVGTMAQVPKALFPLPSAKIDQLLALRISGRHGIGALLAHFLVHLTNAGEDLPSDGARVGTVLLDLMVALLAHELDAGTAVSPETRDRTLLLRIQSFVRQHIGEPQLTPAAVAAAHHISTRHLHRLFQDQDMTVGAWIRSQRLEGSRRDLADRALRLTPIHEIATRWGFSHPAAFSRAFRGAYGLSPRDHRQSALRREVAQR